MQSPVFFSQSLTIEQAVHQILAFRRISAMDQAILRTMVLRQTVLSGEERALLKVLSQRLQQGLLRVI